MKIFKRLRGWLFPQTKWAAMPRHYSTGGWVRGSDGIYRHEGTEEIIHKSGSRWIRGIGAGDECAYATLKAAIAERSNVGAPTLFMGRMLRR